MKTKIFITIIFLISLLSINIASADTCSFLDSNGDCITTVSELNDVEALASLKTINCYWSNCQLTLDVNGDGFITSSDISLIKSIVQLKQTTIDGAPSNYKFRINKFYLQVWTKNNFIIKQKPPFLGANLPH